MSAFDNGDRSRAWSHELVGVEAGTRRLDCGDRGRCRGGRKWSRHISEVDLYNILPTH
jgi:hypothetical protein